MDVRPLSIFDSTLRDGEQAPGNAMAVSQKTALARELELLGVNAIETGFPAASTNDFDTTRALSRTVRRARLCAFARADRNDIQTAFDAIQHAARFQVEILTTVSAIHLEKKRGISLRQALAEARDAVVFARALGFTDVSVAPEDSTRADADSLRQMIDIVLGAGAETIVLPDTVGACVPSEYGELVARVRSWIGPDVALGVHTHNDLGLAVANALAGIAAGADECQVTLCGIGERAGNAALEEVVAALVAKPAVFGRTTTVDTQRIPQACSLLSRAIGFQISRSKPIIGSNAFATAAGIHQSGILKDPKTYEFLDAKQFGARRKLLLARHSGRGALRAKLQGLGIVLDDSALEAAYRQLVSARATVFDDDDLAQLVATGKTAVQGKRA